LSTFIDKEDIVSKLHLIEYFERRWPYPPSRGKPYFERIQIALQNIPSEYQKSALALFANVIYLPEPLLQDTWVYLLNETARRLNASIREVVENAMIFELNEGGLVRYFFHQNKIKGRLDIPRVSTIEKLIDAMILILVPEGQVNKGAVEDIKTIFAKRFWLLLVDNSLSGTSLCSELEKASQILALLEENTPIIIPLIQVFTEDAKNEIEKKISSLGLNTFIQAPVFALYFDSKFKVCEGNEKNCKLFASEETFREVVKLCKWFATETFFANDPELIETKKISGDNLAFGFKAGGWPIVPSPNCPTNSLPLLWYSKTGIYEGPFVRISSRVSQKRGHSHERLKVVLENKDHLLRKLERVKEY
jgi:hypothetical protein